MPLADKVALCSGRDEWRTKGFAKHGAPSVMMSDGPHGLRKQLNFGNVPGLSKSGKATCFPTESLVACSFDKALAGKMGAAIAEEAGAEGVAMVLGPGLNIKRNPLCGRNFEYFSEDPYLSGKLGAAYIAAAQRKGIGTSLKHFACNSQEYFRMVSDSRIDERTLREIYLTAFEYAVREGRPASVMCAYNKINGVYCSDNKYLLTDILRTEWGYEGFVVTDWGAISDRSKAFEAGCDLVMPGGNAYGEKGVCQNVRDGSLQEAYVDRSAERVLRFARSGREALASQSFTVDFEEQHRLARRIAEESAVLLKNENGLLPCNEEDIVIIGRMAEDFRYQGNGSSRVNPTKVDSVLSLLPGVPYAAGYDKDGQTTDEMVREAVELARAAGTVVIVAGLPDSWEAEGLDRADMKLPDGQNRIVEEAAKANPNVVVALCCGCAVETPWADDVKAILYMGLAGQAGAGALVNLLTGRANPCGKLAETWPMRYEDCASAAFYGNGYRNAEYREGVYVGYRYYEKEDRRVRFGFGYGLSYTTFSYHGLCVEDSRVRVTVTNTGGLAGGEPVLMFVRAPRDGIHRPVRELKGFDKVFLAPGESKEVCFDLDDRSYAVWDGEWKVYSGVYGIQIGSCSSECHITGEIYRPPTDEGSREELLKTPDCAPADASECPYTINSAAKDIAKDSLAIRLMLKGFDRIMAATSGRGSVEYRIAMTGAEESPIRNIQNALKLKGHFAQAIADFANKEYRKGFLRLFRQ